MKVRLDREHVTDFVHDLLKRNRELFNALESGDVERARELSIHDDLHLTRARNLLLGVPGLPGRGDPRPKQRAGGDRTGDR